MHSDVLIMISMISWFKLETAIKRFTFITDDTTYTVRVVKRVGVKTVILSNVGLV